MLLNHKDDSPDLPKLKPEPDTLCTVKADEKKFWGKVSNQIFKLQIKNYEISQIHYNNYYL